jgi:hypothetical protein
MGAIGAAVGSEGGSALGGLIGKKLGGRGGAGAGRNIGRVVGGLAGGAFPLFKKGGKVNKTGLAVVHKGEYVLPAGVKPTKAQKAKVAKKKAKK